MTEIDFEIVSKTEYRLGIEQGLIISQKATNDKILLQYDTFIIARGGEEGGNFASDLLALIDEVKGGYEDAAEAVNRGPPKGCTKQIKIQDTKE